MGTVQGLTIVLYTIYIIFFFLTKKDFGSIKTNVLLTKNLIYYEKISLIAD
jgi:hypothetical protein